MTGTRQSTGSFWSPKATKPFSSRSPPSPWPRPAAGVQLGEEQKEGGARGRDSYFVQFGYLRQRDRLAEDVACVLLLELLQGFAKENEKRGQLHLHGDLLDLDLTHIKAQSARPRPVPWQRGLRRWSKLVWEFALLPTPNSWVYSLRSMFYKASPSETPQLLWSFPSLI